MRVWTIALLCAVAGCLLVGAATAEPAPVVLAEGLADTELEAEVVSEINTQAEAEEAEEESAEEESEEASEEEEEAEEEETEQADEESESAEEEEEAEEESMEEAEAEDMALVEEEQEAEEADEEAQEILNELDSEVDEAAGLESVEADPTVSMQELNDMKEFVAESLEDMARFKESEEKEKAEEGVQSSVDVSNTQLHEEYLPYTTPMELLPEALAETAAKTEATTEAASQAKDDDDGGGGGGGDSKNPTYILPVDPFNYYPFFNGFSNVNPFSQFYPPPPYLYPQYVNHMQRYASRANPTPPPYPGVNYPHNYPAPFPHMYYPFGAYKLDTNGPDIPSGANSPEPFPQFVEESATIRPHILTEDSAFRHPELNANEEGVEIAGGNFPNSDSVDFDSDVFVTDVEYSD